MKKKKKKKPGSTRQNLTPDEALALTHTAGAVTMMKKLARLLLAGHTLVSASQRLKRNRQYLVSVTQFPEFQAYMAELEQDYFKALDRKIKNMLDLGVNALIKQLKNPDWRARDSAIEKVFRLHGRYIDRIDVRGSLSYFGQVQHSHDHQVAGVIPGEDMSDELREKSVELLRLTRQLRQPKALPSRFADSALTHQSRNALGRDDEDPEDEPVNGRFVPQGNE